MTTAPIEHSDALVLDYLAALWAESDDLDSDLRDDLMSTVSDYISVRRSSPGDPLSEPAEIIRRLGPPEALVAACRRGHIPVHLRLPALAAPPPVPPAPIRAVSRLPIGGGGVEHAAIGLITAGAVVLPGVGPLAGMLLVTGSPHWNPKEKAEGWTLTIGAGGAALVMALMAAMVGFGTGALLLAYLISAGITVAAGMRLRDALRGR